MTLIELLVTMALVTIVSGIAIPSYIGYLPTIRLKNAIRRLSTVVSLARMAAVSSNLQCRVVFVPDKNYYYALLDSNGNGSNIPDAGELTALRMDQGPVIVGGTTYTGIQLPPGVEFGASAGVTGPPPDIGTAVPTDGVDIASGNVLIVEPRGITNATGAQEAVYLRNAKGETWAARFSYTGLATVYQWTGTGWR